MTGENDVMYHPPDEIKKKAHVASLEEYKRLYKQSLYDPEAFWGRIAEQFDWKQRWQSPFSRCESVQINVGRFETFYSELSSVGRRPHIYQPTVQISRKLRKEFLAQQEEITSPHPGLWNEGISRVQFHQVEKWRYRYHRLFD